MSLTTVNITFKNGTAKRKAKGVLSVEVLNKVVNSEEFRNKVLNYKSKKTGKSFSGAHGLTNAQILAVILSGKEKLTPLENYSWDFQVSFYTKSFSKVVGFTYPNITYINCNTKFFDKYTPAEVCGNFAHEYFHKLGFDHASATDYDSIPYAIGYIIRDLAKKYL